LLGGVGHRSVLLAGRQRPHKPAGRWWNKQGFGPPSVCVSSRPVPPDRHMTPIADPSSTRMGEPDMPPVMGCAALKTHSGPLPRRTEHVNQSPASESGNAEHSAGASAIRSGTAAPISVSYASHWSYSSWPSGAPSTAMSAMGSANRHSAHTVGLSPSELSSPCMSALLAGRRREQMNIPSRPPGYAPSPHPPCDCWGPNWEPAGPKSKRVFSPPRPLISANIF
jgi:hypothetical protein